MTDTTDTLRLHEACESLERTPGILHELLDGRSGPWTTCDEGPYTWTPYDVVGHLIHGERTDWIPRARIIRESGTSQTFTPFDRFAQFEESKGQTLDQLLRTFATLRAANLVALDEMDLQTADLARRGTHPELGTVTLGQLLSTWVVHDFTHIYQIVRVMALRYRDACGPWRQYVRIIR